MATKTKTAAAAPATKTPAKAPAPGETRKHLANAWASVTPEEKKRVGVGAGLVGAGIIIGILAS